MIILEYVKVIFEQPDMPDDVADSILWSVTGWPSFFLGDPIRDLTKQLHHAKRSLARGFTMDQIFAGEDRKTIG
jgi:hypothetical protein